VSYVTLRWLSKKGVEREERIKIDKDIPVSAATRAVNLPHAQSATEEPGRPTGGAEIF
jgi:hypothetical protein